jgi:hypothetical protein
MDKWAEYFKDLLNVQEEQRVEKPQYRTAEPAIESPTIEEVEDVIQSETNDKASGEDSLTAELLNMEDEY